MRPIPFDRFMDRILTEYKEENSVFGITKFYRADPKRVVPMFGETMETPFGPAAGPHTQLAQNIVAAYLCSARFFELKTVQTLDGEDLPVSKPCILAEDEGYNVEWSTELRVGEALGEYIKAWFALKLLSREFSLGGENGFIFNMSVGYDLKGIQSLKIDGFIEGLKDASATEAWAQCRDWTLSNLGRFSRVDEAFVRGISPRICSSITLSTLHGCPPDEIERIAVYLLREKHLHNLCQVQPDPAGLRIRPQDARRAGLRLYLL
jgi:putative selenate reductase